jgi:hypothetical protein
MCYTCQIEMLETLTNMKRYFQACCNLQWFIWQHDTWNDVFRYVKATELHFNYIPNLAFCALTLTFSCLSDTSIYFSCANVTSIQFCFFHCLSKQIYLRNRLSMIDYNLLNVIWMYIYFLNIGVYLKQKWTKLNEEQMHVLVLICININNTIRLWKDSGNRNSMFLVKMSSISSLSLCILK